MNNFCDVSVVIPVFNEENAIRNTVVEVDKILAGMGSNYEIVIVNDGSTDHTVQQLEMVAGELTHIRVLHHEQNIGYGAALKTGCNASGFAKILIIDADKTYPVEQIPELLRLAGTYEMVVGSRTAPGAEKSYLRQIPKYVLKKLAEGLSGRKIPDLNSGFRVFDRKLFEKYAHMLPQGFSFTTTITLLTIQGGHPLIYVPVSYFRREGRSKIKPIRDTLNFFQLILRTVLYLDPLKVFFPLSLVFFLASVVMMLFRIFVDVKFGVSIVLLFTSSCQLLAIGVLADLIDKRLK